MKLTPLAQERAWNTLRAFGTSIPQALILLGPAGVGKRRTAKALYQLLHCTRNAAAEPAPNEPSLFGGPAPAPEPAPSAASASEPCGECVSCRKIAEGRHADLIEVLPHGENIAVDDLREMKKMLYFPPLEGKYRFVIIDEAHKLNAASANTLLKTLEEPPAHTRFFLVTHERGLLLPTIVSRCQFVYFSPLDDVALVKLLEQMQIELPDGLRNLCLDLLGGGLGRAALLADEKVVSFLRSVHRSLEATYGAGSSGGPRGWEAAVRLADELGAEDWSLELFLDIVVWFAHDRALRARTSEEQFQAADLALAAAYLRRRQERYANKKLIALAAANLQ